MGVIANSITQAQKDIYDDFLGYVLNSTPFNLDLLNNAKPECVIYDIIYDPLKTKLLLVSESFGLKTINGLRMNMVQAVLAYKYTNSTNLSLEQVFKTMEDH